MNWNIPLRSGDQLALAIENGEFVFVLGPNGSGKSALIQHLVSSNPNANIRRISAHRRARFQSGSIDLTPHRRSEYARELINYERQHESRWRDHYEEQRQSAVLFDLVARENALARDIARCVRVHSMSEAVALAGNAPSPFDQINELLARGTFAIRLENSNDEEIFARHRDVEAPYSMAQLSDGERNATIIAANVLTVDPGTTILIDEPERHLHRSIIEPFLSALFESRTDCAFIISTHEVALPGAFANARTLMVRSCAWRGSDVRGWDISAIEPNEQLPEDLRRVILGCRQRVLFVEGDTGSMDARLYATLFPGLSIVPRGGCADVQRAVIGLRAASEHHDVDALGLIDRDNLADDEVERLEANGIFALNLCSVESLYYCSDAMDAVAQRQAETMGLDAGHVVARARTRALECLTDRDLVERMAARRCERRARNAVLSFVPSWRSIRAGEKAGIDIRIENPYPEELARVESMVQSGALDDLVARYPLRESRIFDAIAESLMLPNRHAYERAVLVRVEEDEEIAQRLRGHVGVLSAALGW